ncbi:MAG: hypothetical protein EOO54_23610 [Haliea sp.]|nr:MAG: hypothetical protein EOO54_23610 [Haliea sp.]
MNTPLQLPDPHYLGPPPFRFTASRPDLSSPAFSPTFKVLATLIVFSCAASFVQGWLAGRAAGGALTGGGWFLGALLIILYTWWQMLTSRTEIRGDSLYQSWIWDKRLELADLAYGKMIRVRGLEWLIAPRIYVRTLMGKFAVFYAASPEMVVEFERLIAELKAFRAQR